MAAVRSVLLSEIQSVVSLARRRHGYLLSSAQSPRLKQDGQLVIFQSFALLRGRLLRSENMAELSPVNLLRPFLDVIRHDHTSSTVTGAALQAVQKFLHTWPWTDVKDQDAVAEAVADIVDAVSHCRFQETSAESDQNVLVLVVHVLHAVVRSPCGARLSDHSMWQLVESLYALSRASRHDPHITMSLRSTATSFLHEAVAFIFSNAAVYADSSAGSHGASGDGFRPGFGLPCAVKTVGFLCQKLHQRSFAASSASAAVSASTGGVASRREVFLSFSLLQRALVTCDAELLTQVPSLMLFIKDDLCSAILRYCRLGACSELKVPVVCLEIIRLLWSKLRSELKMQVEAIINGIFGHTLHWTIANMDVNNPNFPRGDDVGPSTAGDAQGSANGKPTTTVDAAIDEFTGEMLSTGRLFSVSFEILDCLVDLLAEATLLPDLYVNYDCDGNRCDLTQNLFELLSQVVQQSNVACFESHEEAHFLWAQAAGEIALRGMFNALYVVHLRTQQQQPKIGSTSTGESSSAGPSEDEANDDTLIVDQEEQPPLPASGSGFATADALFKKRQRKKFFQHGIQEFNRKPLAGIKYLQQNSFLPTPLDSASLATFLRSLPQGLNKNAVGVYLGAMGKEVKGFEKTEIHEADTMDFHRDVLTNFVRSFNFESESIVAALRMFLASFRLPGEAQQIDRILNTFSLQVYEQCRERFLMASVDVAYLLSFSLIMLNTDLHNPNIRPEKKMKLGDFIKNNKNYGQEVSNGRDLPDDFLTELYDTIAKDEIKTFEDGGKHGEVTSDRWKDLLIQAESDPRNSRFIVHHPSLHAPASSSPHVVAPPSASAPLAPHVMHTMKQAELVKSGPSASNDAASPGNATSDAIPLNDASSGNQYDRHIFELVQQNLVRAFASVFQQFVEESNAKDAGEGDGHSSLDTSSGDAVRYVPQKNVLQLACNGFVLCATVASRLSLVEHCNALFVRMCKYTALLSSDIYVTGYNGRESGIWVFCSNQSAPVATAAVLKLASTCSLSLQSRSWKYFFHVVSGLREFHALPSSILHPMNELDLELMTADERLEFIDLVYQNKEELERKLALSAQGQVDGSADGGGFFSGVAWLLSALDSNLGGSVANSSAPGDSSGSTKSHLSPGFEQYQLSPAELASHTEDLVIEGKPPRKPVEAEEQDERGDFGTDEWIRTTLQPYRLEFLVHDVASLPSRALAEVIEALHDEILQKLRGVEDKSPQQDRKKSVKRSLSQGGCVLFEHLLSQVIALSGSLFGGGADDEDGISAVLEAHYSQLLEFLCPVLLVNASPSGMTYENACFLLHKAINGLFAWATRTRSDASGTLLVTFLANLMELGDSDELIRPFLSPIMCGLVRYVALVQPTNLRYTRMDWLTVCNLISWSVERPHAASHAFGLLERLVTGKIWNVEGNEILISDIYTKMIMFAVKPRDPHDTWAPSRPLELLLLMFDTLRPDAPNYVEERLRFIGGMAVVCRHLLLNQLKLELPNELVVLATEGLKHMLREHSGNDESFKATAWLDVLRYGLVPIGLDLLDGKAATTTSGVIRPFGADQEETNSPFLYYRRQLSSRDDGGSLQRPNASQTETRSPTGRRRRPLVMKDPQALRPHVVVVQLLSLVVCEELTPLLTCEKFPSVWENVVKLLIGLLESTAIASPASPRDGNASGEVLIAALERRSVLSAHEEILEHVKGIVRRLAVLQDAADEHATPNEEQTAEEGADDGNHQPDALLQVLVEQCRAYPELFEQLFPSKDDGASTGGRTPPVEELDGEAPAEDDSDAEESSSSS